MECCYTAFAFAGLYVFYLANGGFKRAVDSALGKLKD